MHIETKTTVVLTRPEYDVLLLARELMLGIKNDTEYHLMLHFAAANASDALSDIIDDYAEVR